ncbi:MAG: hypothetical protein AB7S26_37565 [Sandaracinaceae bacterium]
MLATLRPRLPTMLLLALSTGAGGCVPIDTALPGPDEADALSVSLDGVPVDCTRTTRREMGARGEVAVYATHEFSARLDELDIADRFVADRFDGDAVRRATIELTPDVAHTLVLESGAHTCRVRLAHRPAVAVALSELRAASASPPALVRSHHTGAVSGGALSVPTEGATSSERGRDFLRRYASALGVSEEELLDAESWTDPDGWVRLGYTQRSHGVRALDASLQLVLDARGVVRAFHAHLFEPAASAPTFVRDPDAVLAVVGDRVGVIEGFERVLYDAAEPRAGWLVVGEEGRAVVDDADGELRVVEPAALDAPMEIGRPRPHPYTGVPRALPPHTILAMADHTAPPPPLLDAVDAEVWTVAGAVASSMEARVGDVGWADHHIRIVTQPEPVESGFGTSRVAGAFYEHPRMFLSAGYRQERDTICHEYGHAFDGARGGVMVPLTLAEAYGDLFFVFCQRWVHPEERPFLENLGRALDDASSVRPDQRDYDEFLASGLQEARIGNGAELAGSTVDTHDHAWLVSLAFHHMIDAAGFDWERAERLALDAAGSRGVTYPDLRDHILVTAVSWAREGRYGFTEEDACAVAQGFRTTHLDGEYGEGVGCGDAEDRELVCTDAYCPLCDEAPSAVCPPETLADGQPVCMTADDRRTCLGSIAPSAEGCAMGEAHHCWCVDDEAGGARWSCETSPECRPFARAAYCPEVNRDAPSSTDAMPPASCAAGVGPRSSLAAVFALLLAIFRLRRRARARVTIVPPGQSSLR